MVPRPLCCQNSCIISSDDLVDLISWSTCWSLLAVLPRPPRALVAGTENMMLFSMMSVVLAKHP